MTLSERIESFPWSKAVVGVGILAYLGILVFAAIVLSILLVFKGLRPVVAELPLFAEAKSYFRDGLDAALWAMGIGGGAIVGKRAATKASVIAAQAVAAPPGTPAAFDASDEPRPATPAAGSGPSAVALAEPVKAATPTGDVVYVHPASTGGGGDESDA